VAPEGQALDAAALPKNDGCDNGGDGQDLHRRTSFRRLNGGVFYFKRNSLLQIWNSRDIWDDSGIHILNGARTSPREGETMSIVKNSLMILIPVLALGGGTVFAQSSEDQARLQQEVQRLQQIIAAQQTATPPQNPPAVTAPVITPKRKGVVRIGAIFPSVTWQQAEGETTPPGIPEDLRTMTVAFLSGDNIETIPIIARLPQLAISEAKKSECDALLSLTLQRTPGKSKTNMFGALRAAGGMIPGLGTLNRGVMVGTQIAAAATNAASSIAGGIRPKDSISFRYDLTIPGGATLTTGQSDVKAQSAGQDVLTPIMTAMADSVLKKLLPNQQ